MTKRMLIMLVSVALLFGLVFGFEAFRNAFIAKMMSSLGAPIQVVATAKAVRTAWQPRLSAVGSLRAVTGADLAFEVAGIVSAIAGALAKVGANIDSLLQRPGYPKHNLPFVITTEPCLTSTIEKAVAAMAKFDCMLERPLCLQILTIDDKAE